MIHQIQTQERKINYFHYTVGIPIQTNIYRAVVHRKARSRKKIPSQLLRLRWNN
jgi:hypothetical protein